MFSGGQQAGSTGGGLFGSTTNTGTGTAQTGTTGGGLFGGGLGANTAQTQAKPTFGGLGSSTAGGGATNNVVPGVKVDTSNLLPTTKFDSCTDELRSQIEFIDNYILNQMKMSHELADLLPNIETQGASIPNDVDFVQNKLETLQHALENDASDIDGLRNIVLRDAGEAQVTFRAIDMLKLPLQYQSASGGWWSVQDQKVPERRSTRKNTLALPDEVDGDPSTATEVNGVPVNLVDYFSLRADEMGSVLDRYKGNLKEIEDHLYGVELSLNRQINEFVSSRSRDGAGHGAPKSAINDLAAVLGMWRPGSWGWLLDWAAYRSKRRSLLWGLCLWARVGWVRLRHRTE
ncbi:hypothetical protein N7468_003700 [Penicillium chermesinum]|uniref:Nucleoporin NUP49/NSP49 n=1 Tax=Penicillium chermesinum TaxID=63820 RepID=A0A9W9P7P6_9EURO|nr:uncharacterized protein N7468_003700 [Penicillium chermesinum]KAJ5239081.1 hypothetical protein N7468_003700 [Penicillium chermesinum]